MQDKVISLQTYIEDKCVPKEQYRCAYNAAKEEVERKMMTLREENVMLSTKLSFCESNTNNNSNSAPHTINNTQRTNSKPRAIRRQDSTQQNAQLFKEIDDKINNNWCQDKYYWNKVDITEKIGDVNQRHSFYNRATANELARICLYANIGDPKIRKNAHGSTGLMTHVTELKDYCSLNFTRTKDFIEYLKSEGWALVCNKSDDKLTEKEKVDIGKIYFDYHRDYKGTNIKFSKNQGNDHGSDENRNLGLQSQDHGSQNHNNGSGNGNNDNNNNNNKDSSVSPQQQSNLEGQIRT